MSHVSRMGFIFFVLLSATAHGAAVVPTDIMQPGTQPKEAQNLESPDKCDNCHAGYDVANVYSSEPAFGWRGGPMGNAGRDPIFWATLAVAEQDFDGAGDLCIRCHSTAGWYAGRSTPTDGSGLLAGDDDGVDCDTCHIMTNPDQSEHAGVFAPGFEPFGPGGEGYFGSGILALFGGSTKLGPYDNADARHQWMQSIFHRGELCGSCHDVSNPAVGDLAPNNGAQIPLPSGTFNGTPNVLDPLQDPTTKAAFNNPPYAYGVVERTYSEWKASALDTTPVSGFDSLPGELRKGGGALDIAYQAALKAGKGGDYFDNSPRYFTCQSCHMRPTVGKGADKNGVPTRSDLPLHDQTGGNYWLPPIIRYQDLKGTLRLGGGLTQVQIDAMAAGAQRARDHLFMAASLSVSGDVLTVTNLTGHKLISGYPEGRRMWLNIKWYDAGGTLLHEDGAYGPLGVTFTNPVDGTPFTPLSILDPGSTRIYEAHYAMTREWAQVLIGLGYSPDLALKYDRLNGSIKTTLGTLADGASGNYADTFHFALNDHVSSDNRIPPYGFDRDEAAARNALPVPADQYGNPVSGGVYDHWDEYTLSPPSTEAVYADISLLYQGTSWEYIQFLWLANNKANAFLGQEGDNMLDAWINADPLNPMVPPVVMATATWGSPPACVPTEEPEVSCSDGLDNDCDGLFDGTDPDCQVIATCSDFTNRTDCRNAGCSWNARLGVCR